MSKGLIIVNPHARSGFATWQRNTQRDRIVERLQPILGTIEWSETQYPRHATRLAQDAAEQNYDYVLAAGGDGTIHEVLNGIMSVSKKRPVFGVVPWGSLNDFHKALRVADHSIDGDARTLAIDVGKVICDRVERYAGLSVSIGLASWANHQYQLASLRFGRILGLFPGAIQALLSYRFPRSIGLAINGESPRHVPMLSISLNNSPTVGGGAKLTPNAMVNDGRFDMCLIPPMSLLQLFALLARSYFNRGVDPHQVTLRPVSEISITASAPLPIHIDGEMVPEISSQATSIHVTVLPLELNVLRPSLLD